MKNTGASYGERGAAARAELLGDTVVPGLGLRVDTKSVNLPARKLLGDPQADPEALASLEEMILDSLPRTSADADRSEE